MDDIVDFPIKNSDFFFHCYVSLPEGNDTVDDIVDFPIKNSDFFSIAMLVYQKVMILWMI